MPIVPALQVGNLYNLLGVIIIELIENYFHLFVVILASFVSHV